MVTGVVPSALRFSSSIFIVHRVQQSHCSWILHRVLLPHAPALSASQFVHKKKAPRIYTRMHSGGLELMELNSTRLEDNLLCHRGDRSYNGVTACTWETTCGSLEAPYGRNYMPYTAVVHTSTPWPVHRPRYSTTNLIVPMMTNSSQQIIHARRFPFATTGRYRRVGNSVRRTR